MVKVISPTVEERLSRAIAHLITLKEAYEQEVMPTMIHDGDHQEQIVELEELIFYLESLIKP